MKKEKSEINTLVYMRRLWALVGSQAEPSLVVEGTKQRHSQTWTYPGICLGISNFFCPTISNIIFFSNKVTWFMVSWINALPIQATMKLQMKLIAKWISIHMTTVRSKSCEFVAQMAPYRRILCSHGIYNIMPKVGPSSMASTVLAIPVLSGNPERNLEKWKY